MTFPLSPQTNDRSPAPAAPRLTTVALEPGAGYSVDELYDFFDFFDKSVGDVYAYILHCTRVPELAQDIVLSVYFSLLQRRRVYFWKNVVQLSTLLALADKAIGSMQKWEGEAMGSSSYLEELLRCSWDGKEKGTLERMHLLFQTLKKFPLREQKLVVIQFFLRWPAGKTASILGKTKQSVEREYAAVEQLLVSELQKEAAFQGVYVHDVLRSLHCPPLPEDRKTSIRMTLLERCRSAQLSSLRFAVPIAASSALVGCVLIFAVLLTPSLPAKGTLRQIAAVEVLLLAQERETLNTLLEAEETLRGITAHYAGRELAYIGVRLAPQAMTKELDQQNTIRGIVHKLSFGGFFRPPSFISFEEALARGE